MSTINMHPPQTYSRLFRPWDSHTNAVDTQQQQAINLQSQLKNAERIAAISPAVKSESDVSFSGDSDRECCSSSSYKSSYEDGLNNSQLSQIEPLPSSSGASSPISDMHRNAYEASRLYPTNIAMDTTTSAQAHSHHYSQMPLMAPHAAAATELYYAAAAAAAAAASSSAMTNSAANNAFGMDPYTLGLMEQEYARVMAEEAHLKALNARKQRPKKFKCPHCDVAFSNNGQLKGHIRIHTGKHP